MCFSTNTKSISPQSHPDSIASYSNPLMCSRRGKNRLCLVLAPTRELARQVEKEFREFASSLDTICLYGGIPMGQ
ncbi:unnamed protein product [Brassica napus]|nr:unnamed protein product [Brassica napus]